MFFAPFTVFCFCRLLIALDAALIRSRDALRLNVLGLSLDAGQRFRQDALAEYSSKTGIQFDLIPTPGTSRNNCPWFLIYSAAIPLPRIYTSSTLPGPARCIDQLLG